MAVVSMRQMLEAGVHFGHQTRRWNPKMKQFIFGERNGIHIINLDQTLERIETAYEFVRDLVANGGTILFVGTKKQAQDPIRSYAEKCGMYYVNERWLGGMLTNFETISKRVGKMQEYERMKVSGEFEAMPKKEALLLTRELDKLQKNLSGISNLARRPDAIFVLDTMKEHIAVTEANKLKIPVIAVVDSNVDPDVIQFPIPGNDDAIRANDLLTRVIAEAVIEGRFIAQKRNPAAAAAAAPAAAPQRRNIDLFTLASIFTELPTDMWTFGSANPIGLEPVVVRPSAQVIAQATEIVSGSTLPEGTLCSICQDSILATDSARKLRACNHLYHQVCIDQWFQRSVFCPTCRHDVREA